MQEGDSARSEGRCKKKGTVPGEGDNLTRGQCKEKGTVQGGGDDGRKKG